MPDSFRIARNLLSRLEDPVTGKILPKEFYVDIPTERKELAFNAAKALGNSLMEGFPFIDGVKPVQAELGELALNKWW